MPNLNLDLLEPNDNTITIKGETLNVHRVPLYVVLKAPEVYGRYTRISKKASEKLTDEQVNKDYMFLVKCVGMVLRESGNEKPEDWILEHFDLMTLHAAITHILYVREQKKRPEKKINKSTGGD